MPHPQLSALLVCPPSALWPSKSLPPPPPAPKERSEKSTGRRPLPDATTGRGQGRARKQAPHSGRRPAAAAASGVTASGRGSPNSDPRSPSAQASPAPPTTSPHGRQSSFSLSRLRVASTVFLRGAAHESCPSLCQRHAATPRSNIPRRGGRPKAASAPATLYGCRPARGQPPGPRHFQDGGVAT